MVTLAAEKRQIPIRTVAPNTLSDMVGGRPHQVKILNYTSFSNKKSNSSPEFIIPFLIP